MAKIKKDRILNTDGNQSSVAGDHDAAIVTSSDVYFILGAFGDTSPVTGTQQGCETGVRLSLDPLVAIHTWEASGVVIGVSAARYLVQRVSLG
jgi:hypothetical protein